MDDRLLNDRYKVIETLGSGGFGETFLAEDTYMPSLRRCVVKKLLQVQRSADLTQLIRDRFQREAATLERLGNGHSQIPSLYAYFYGKDDGQFYLVQELVEGESLSSLIAKRGILSEGEVRQFLVDIIPVFSYIHSNGIVHRDVKPDNIIFRHHDRLPVLIDFGAVREAIGTEIGSQGQSIVIGTPGYMASEQAMGRPVYSSDIYSLGMTAIYLLTGKTPSQLPVNDEGTRFIWQNEVPQISSNLAEIIDRSIGYHPSDRFANADAFLQALQGVPIVLPTTTMTPYIPTGNDNPRDLDKEQAATPSLTPSLANPPIANNPNKLLIGMAIVATFVSGLFAAAFFLKDGKTANNTPRVVATDSPRVCRVNDPTETPLNIREIPNGKIVGTVNNGQSVEVFRMTTASNGKQWAFIGRGYILYAYISCPSEGN
jgi:serine/threonine protein kinase, bacterial